MSLTLTLDYSHKVVSEPGHHVKVSSDEISQVQDPTGADRFLWSDPLLSTIMLKPLQLDPSWLDSTQQMDSIIRLADLVVDTSDVSNHRVVERATQTNANPWIWMLRSTQPASYYPAAPNPMAPVPGVAPPLVGISAPELPEIDLTTIHSHDTYVPPATMPPKGAEPVPVIAGTWADAKTIARTNTRMPANAAFFFRWHMPGGAEPNPNETIYVIHVGQFALHFRGVTVQVFEDTSPHGDRSAGVKRLTYPLWGTADESDQQRARTFNKTSELGVTTRDRWLLWLPMRRNKVLLMADSGRAVILWTRPDNQKQRNAAGTDWVNVREDTLQVKIHSPVFVRFQIQRVKYKPGPYTLDGPVSIIPYQPSTPPVLSIGADRDNLTFLTGVMNSPPTTNPARRAEEDCTPLTADPPSWLAKKYRPTFTLEGSADGRWTPFLYGYAFDSPPVLVNSTPAAVTVADTGAGTRLIDASFSLGKKPGEGRGKVEVLDFDPFPVAGHYYRSAVPVQLTDGAVKLFTGWTEPIEMTPLHEATTKPRRVTLPIIDGWKLLSRSHVRNGHDFTGVGHITAVLRLAQEAGIDVSTAETPPINTTALDRRWNTPFGGETLLATDAKENHSVTSPWATRTRDTYAGFIQRVVQLFSGWDVGFRADGTLFYLPRDYFTASSLTFYASQAARTTAADPTAPLFRDPVTFTTEEPEANVIIVQSGKATDGAVTFSPTYIDWASIKNPNVKNYLGMWRAEVVVVGGGWTCPQLNLTARRIWDQTRRRFLNARWEGDYRDTIKVGHVVTLGTYGLYRVTSIKAECVRIGWRPASYTGTLLERGYGL
jgi:hypothetical protein